MKIKTLKNRIEKLDRAYLWHPFTQMQEWAEEPPLIVTEGRGVFLKDIYGCHKGAGRQDIPLDSPGPDAPACRGAGRHDRKDIAKGAYKGLLFGQRLDRGRDRAENGLSVLAA